MQLPGEPYTRHFFERPPDEVAHDLIGSLIIVRDADRELRARIVETEAYGGSDDPASHAYRGMTKRCAVMFGPAGFLYVYRSYGLHWCMNVVTEKEGLASAVLLRAAEIVKRYEDAVPLDAPGAGLRGPGNLTRGLGITGSDDGEDCCQVSVGRISFQETPGGVAINRIGRSRRIGISQGQDRLSRYFLEEHSAVSVNRRPITKK